MKRISLFAGLLLAGGAIEAASATSFAGTAAGTSAGASSDGSSASSRTILSLPELLREDAASFVASQGQVRSARLEAARRGLREHDAQARQADDLELARKILAAR